MVLVGKIFVGSFKMTASKRVFTVLQAVTENGTWVKSLTGEYKYEGPPKQFYALLDAPPVSRVVFRVLSNQGNPRYTCVYRVHLYEKDWNVPKS